ncbi:MAG TPA: hypothetical protein VM689_19000 [Aliidongia sp.]|nr:hypothetical protein [Aliidongia sp.]
MYRDNSLIPIEAIRIAALGALAERPLRYAELASDVRRFSSRIVGPSLDLMGSSIEVLRIEALIAPVAADAAEPDPRLELTEAGGKDLILLLKAGVRATNTDLNRLVVALKMRFLHLLAPEDRRDQVLLLTSLLQDEHKRYSDLRANDAAEPLFAHWLDFEIEMLDNRLRWLDDFVRRCLDK